MKKFSYLSAWEDFFKKWRDFEGRTPATEYWYVISSLIALGFLEHFLFFYAYIHQETAQWDALTRLYLYVMIGQIFLFIFPLTAMTVRRLRDVKRNGFWVLIVLIPLLFLIFLNFINSFFFNENGGSLLVIFLWISVVLWLIFASVLLLAWCGQKTLITAEEEEKERILQEKNPSEKSFEEILEAIYFKPEDEKSFDDIEGLLSAIEACCAEGFRRYNKEHPTEETHLWGALLSKAEMINLLLAEARLSEEDSLYMRFLYEVERGLASLLRQAQLCDDEELYMELSHLSEGAQKEVALLRLSLSNPS